jgi:UDP-N-acetylmuramoyl-tripeptide--D-alanyl-D-alanine ligase
MINSRHFNNSKFLVKVYGQLPEGDFSICTDSRKYESGQVFYAINGENFDGFDYVENVLKSVCPIVVFESNEKNRNRLDALDSKKTCFIEVEDTVAYLQDLGRHRRDDFKASCGVIFGITGSNGKTSHKEMLKALLESVFGKDVHSTRGNLNNHLGVPMTLLDLEDHHKICILEMGTNHPGEIPALCEIGDHDHGMITNIGQSHLEFFYNEENVFKEKRALFDHVELKGTGFFVVPSSDKFLSNLEGKTLTKTNYTKQGSKVEFEVGGGIYEFENPNLGGDYNYSNMVTCLSLACLVYPEHAEKFLNAASTYQLPEMNRANWIEKGSLKIFMDAYNANPSSMKVSLEYFFQYLKDHNISKEHAVVILGDMNELGEKSPSYHQEIGHILKRFNHQNSVFIGRFSSDYKSGAANGVTYDSAKQYHESKPNLSGFTHAFIKGSRSLQLESLIDIF